MFHPFFSALAEFFQTGGVFVEKARFLQFLSERLADVLVIIFENSLTEGLDLPNHVPCLVVGNTLHDIFHQPLKKDICCIEVFDQMIHRQFLYLVVVESDS